MDWPLAGAGAARFRIGCLDVTLVAVYFPVKPQGLVHWRSYEQTSAQLAGWISEELGQIATRSTPIVATDLNDGLGMDKEGFIESSTLGDLCARSRIGFMVMRSASLVSESWACG